jgi:hypothetical protein
MPKAVTTMSSNVPRLPDLAGEAGGFCVGEGAGDSMELSGELIGWDRFLPDRKQHRQNFAACRFILLLRYQNFLSQASVA